MYSHLLPNERHAGSNAGYGHIAWIRLEKEFHTRGGRWVFRRR